MADCKTMPICKQKGQSKNIENYRPIENLCTASKICNKLIMKRIIKIHNEERVDRTVDGHNGFKIKRSTSTLSTKLLSEIPRALDGEVKITYLQQVSTCF